MVLKAYNIKIKTNNDSSPRIPISIKEQKNFFCSDEKYATSHRHTCHTQSKGHYSDEGFGCDTF